MAEERAKKLGMERRAFMASSMGLATCFLANNMVFGPQSCWAVDEIESLEPGAYEDKYPKGEYFVMDVQSHFTNGFAIPGFRDAEFVKNMGFNLKTDKDAYGYRNFVKEMFFDSDTEMIVISGSAGLSLNPSPQIHTGETITVSVGGSGGVIVLSPTAGPFILSGTFQAP